MNEIPRPPFGDAHRLEWRDQAVSLRSYDHKGGRLTDSCSVVPALNVCVREAAMAIAVAVRKFLPSRAGRSLVVKVRNPAMATASPPSSSSARILSTPQTAEAHLISSATRWRRYAIRPPRGSWMRLPLRAMIDGRRCVAACRLDPGYAPGNAPIYCFRPSARECRTWAAASRLWWGSSITRRPSHPPSGSRDNSSGDIARLAPTVGRLM